MGSPIGRPCDFVVAFIRSNVPSPTVVFRHFRQSGSFDVLYGLPVVRLEIYRRKRYTVFAEGYNGRGFTMVEDHLKQTQRLYEVIVRSAFLYEVPVRSALQRVALNDLYEVPGRPQMDSRVCVGPPTSSSGRRNNEIIHCFPK